MYSTQFFISTNVLDTRLEHIKRREIECNIHTEKKHESECQSSIRMTFKLTSDFDIKEVSILGTWREKRIVENATKCIRDWSCSNDTTRNEIVFHITHFFPFAFDFPSRLLSAFVFFP
jgi:hypothetical protein